MDKKVIIIEGFEMVGKTTFFEKFSKSGRVSLYVPSHDLTDKTIGRDNSWVIGWSILDFLSKVNTNRTIVIDRGVFSSIVYEKLHNHHRISDEVVDYYKSSQFFRDSVEVMYFYHKDKSSARDLFERSKMRKKNDNELSAQYDTFSSFEEYWKEYRRFHYSYLLAFARLGVVPTFVETYNGGYCLRGSNVSRYMSLEECSDENWTLC